MIKKKRQTTRSIKHHWLLFI